MTIKRSILAVFLILFSSPAAWSQGFISYRIRTGAAVPATCDANRGEVFFVTTAATRGVFHCVAANTWANLGTLGTAAFLRVNNLTRIYAPADGQLRVTNNADADGNRDLILGLADATGLMLRKGTAVGGAAQGLLLLHGDGTDPVFADLGAAVNGTIIYCSDCAIGAVCAGAGTGALAKRLNGAWVCN